MDVEKEIKAMVRAAAMEEINALSIRATLREMIVVAGFSHEDVRKMIQEAADSYFRSAMNGSVEAAIKQIFNQKIEEAVNQKITAVLGGFMGWSGSDKVKEALSQQVALEIKKGFNITLSIEQKRIEET